MTSMLASVADVFECEIAINCGADWIDVKDPRDGALGAAAPSTVRDIVLRTAGRKPVSATIGDCWSTPESIPGRVALMQDTGVDYIKAGVDPVSMPGAARDALSAAGRSSNARLIAVCPAETLPAARHVESLAQASVAGIMLDTRIKDGPRLTELASCDRLREFVAQVRGLGLLCGLAGRLRLADVPGLLPLGANYLGFRSALCANGERAATISQSHTRSVSTLIQSGCDAGAERTNTTTR